MDSFNILGFLIKDFFLLIILQYFQEKVELEFYLSNPFDFFIY